MQFPVPVGMPLEVRHRSRAMLVALILVAVSITTMLRATPAHADSVSDENRFVELINNARTSAGLPALAVHPALIAAGRSWAGKMLAASSAAGTSGCLISHNPDLRTAVAASWRKLGENVGCGDVPVGDLHQKFMDSPAHRANIMDPEFDTIGIGIVFDASGMMWVTEQFMDLDDRAPTTAAPAPAALALSARVKGISVTPTTKAKVSVRAVKLVPRKAKK